jgi:hypothetical protein
MYEAFEGELINCTQEVHTAIMLTQTSFYSDS